RPNRPAKDVLIAPRPGRTVASALVLILTAAACTGGSHPRPAPTPGSRATGGTLRVGVLIDGGVGRCDLTFCGGQENDPQINGIDGPTYEILRCCLLRSLLSYN